MAAYNKENSRNGEAGYISIDAFGLPDWQVKIQK